MKIFVLLMIGTLFISCGKDETKYLYSKYDKEYQALRALAMEQCQSESPIFKALQKSNTSSKWEGKYKGQIYRSVEKAEREATKTRYFKVHKIDGDEMEIILNSSVAGENKLIVFHREEDGTNILKEVSEGVCHEPDPLYSHSSLEDKKSLKFIQARIEGSDSHYDKIIEEFYLKTNIPLVLFYWSGKITTETKTASEKITKIYKRDFDIIDKNECPSNDPQQLCSRFPNPSTLPRCEVSVTQNAGSNDSDVNLSLISLECLSATEI